MSTTIETPPTPVAPELEQPKRKNALLRTLPLPVWAVIAIAVVLLAALIASLSGFAGFAVEHARAQSLAKQVTSLKKQQAASDSSASSSDSSSDTSTDDTSSSFEYDKSLMYMTLKTTSKKCFGSAGCNVEVQPQLGMLDTSGIPDDASGQLTFEITGGEDGPVIDTIDLTGTRYDVSSESISTSSSGVKLKVKITDVTTY